MPVEFVGSLNTIYAQGASVLHREAQTGRNAQEKINTSLHWLQRYGHDARARK